MRYDTEQLREWALKHLWMHNADWSEMAQTEEPLIIVEGSGLRVRDSNGKTWIDINGGYASVAVGYGRQEIADAAYQQMKQITYFPQRTANPSTIQLAVRLAELTPGGLNRSFFASGGSEANETALKIARAYQHRHGASGRYKIISRRDSYHGGTGGVLWLGSAAGSPRTDYEPSPPGILHGPQPLAYRCEFGSTSPAQCAIRCAEEIERLILEEGPDTICAVIAEPIASGPGAAVPGDEYWPMLREICDRYGVLLIADEVITGFGRTGKLFACEHWGVVPDIMTVAKGMCSSYLPLGAAISSETVANSFAGENRMLRHVFTFAGHPVAAAAGLQNIDILVEEQLVQNAAEVGSYFKAQLQSLITEARILGDVRGIGLMLSLDFVADRQTKAPFPKNFGFSDRLNTQLKKRGLLARSHANHLLNLSPPLCITRSEVDEVTELLRQAIHAVGESWEQGS